MKGVLLGALAGLLLTFLFRKPKKEQSEKEEDRWSVKLALLGVAMGVFTTLGMGYTNIGFMIGFAIPMSLILGCVGLVIDFFRYRKKKDLLS
jgi:hypothetical protein